MSKTFWIESFSGAKLKSKIQNPKWVEMLRYHSHILDVRGCGGRPE
jgi:hypothetical protein